MQQPVLRCSPMLPIVKAETDSDIYNYMDFTALDDAAYVMSSIRPSDVVSPVSQDADAMAVSSLLDTGSELFTSPHESDGSLSPLEPTSPLMAQDIRLDLETKVVCIKAPPMDSAQQRCGSRGGSSTGTETDSFSGEDLHRKVCLVCGDVASGYHYGVASCEACKAFFKRTIQGNIDYICPSRGACEINKRRRKACQACRFQKCLTTGMLREGVRLDRVRGGRQKYRRTSDSSVFYGQPDVKRVLTYDTQLVSGLLQIEPGPLVNVQTPDINDKELTHKMVVSECADRELVATIGWSRQVEGFSELPLADQMNLLQNSWLEILNLNLCFRSCPYSGILRYAENYTVSEDDTRQLPTSLDRTVKQIATKLTQFNMSREEYVLLKCILLYNPDANVSDPAKIQIIRDKYIQSLDSLTKHQHPNAPCRLGNILTCFQSLAQAKVLSQGYWRAVRDDGKVQLHKLFLEMLESE